MNEANVPILLNVMRSYSPEEVDAAYELFKDVLKRETTGWTEWSEQEEPPDGVQKQFVGEKVFIKVADYVKERSITREEYTTPPPAASASGGAKKADVSMVLAPNWMRCPECSDRLYQQAICPGCKEGKAGYKLRFLCGNCDFTTMI